LSERPLSTLRPAWPALLPDGQRLCAGDGPVRSDPHDLPERSVCGLWPG
jgi:hypothetical protein